MQNIRDESGNTLFHYAVGCLDEDSIYHMMSTGVDLMSTNHIEVAVDQQDYGFATEQLVTGSLIYLDKYCCFHFIFSECILVTNVILLLACPLYSTYVLFH